VKIVIGNENLEVGRCGLIEVWNFNPRFCMELWRITMKYFRIAGDAAAVWNIQ
jgi:hypothetical protein